MFTSLLYRLMWIFCVDVLCLHAFLINCDDMQLLLQSDIRYVVIYDDDNAVTNILCVFSGCLSVLWCCVSPACLCCGVVSPLSVLWCCVSPVCAVVLCLPLAVCAVLWCCVPVCDVVSCPCLCCGVVSLAVVLCLPCLCCGVVSLSMLWCCVPGCLWCSVSLCLWCCVPVCAVLWCRVSCVCGVVSLSVLCCGVAQDEGSVECLPCRRGHYCSNETTSAEVMLSVMVCPAGFLCSQGLDREPQRSAVFCPIGFYCPGGSIVSAVLPTFL